MNSGRKLFPRLMVVTIVCLLASTGVFYAWYISTPRYVAQQALVALENHDTNSLINLADPEEVRKLGLTTEAVKTILSKTLWDGGSLANGKKKEVVGKYNSDESLWTYQWNDSRFKIRPINVLILDDPSKGWKLNLSSLLYDTCWHHEGGPKGRILYYRLAKSTRINGLRKINGNYEDMDTIRSLIVHFYGADFESAL